MIKYPLYHLSSLTLYSCGDMTDYKGSTVAMVIIEPLVKNLDFEVSTIIMPECPTFTEEIRKTWWHLAG